MFILWLPRSSVSQVPLDEKQIGSFQFLAIIKNAALTIFSPSTFVYKPLLCYVEMKMLNQNFKLGRLLLLICTPKHMGKI